MKALEEYGDHLRLCHELKQTINQLMGWAGSLTHRQFKVWQRWLRDEWEKPNRTDRYIMRLIAVVDGLFSKERPPEEEYKIRFANSPSTQSTTTRENNPVSQSTIKTPNPNRKIPVDPTGETIIVPPCPELSPDEEAAQDERIKRSETVWLGAFAGNPKLKTK